MNNDNTPTVAAVPAEPVGHVRIDSGELHFVPKTRDAESSGFRDGQPLYAAAQATPPAPDVKPSNVGQWCMSEDECRAAGIDFAAYERGVSDAAEAFGRNK